MFRVKVALIAAGVVAVVTGAVFMGVTSRLDENVTKRVEATVKTAQEQILRSSRLESVDLTKLTADFAREEEFISVLGKGSEDERRQGAYAACEAHFARMEKDGKKPGVIGVVDARGRLIARDHSLTWRTGDDLTKDFPSLGLALAGGATKDVWDLDGAMYRIGAAAVRNSQGQVLGAVFVGYVQSAADATEEAARSNVDVAWFFASKGKLKIHASSFKRAGGAPESSEERDLARQLFEEEKLAAPTTDKHEATPLFRIRLSGEEWVAATAPLAGNIEKSSTRSGFVVLTSLSQAKAPFMPIGMMVLLVGLVGLLAAVGAAAMTARRFLNPLDKVEGGVAEVINGNRDYVFESPSQDFEGLANGLNVMLARLLGRPEPGDDEEGGDSGENDALFVDEAAAAAAGGAMAASAEASALAGESPDAYYDRVWREYVAARQQTGEGTDGLDRNQFLGKLKQSEVALAQKYGARMVRFKVVIKGNQTTLKPVPIA